MAGFQELPSRTVTVAGLQELPFQTLIMAGFQELPFQTLPSLKTVIVSIPVSALPPALVALILKLTAPAVVGVPVIAPVLVFRVSPAGKVPEPVFAEFLTE
jgi:hypothetical protein